MNICPSPCLGPSAETDQQLLGLRQEGQGDVEHRPWPPGLKGTHNSCSCPANPSDSSFTNHWVSSSGLCIMMPGTPQATKGTHRSRPSGNLGRRTVTKPPADGQAREVMWYSPCAWMCAQVCVDPLTGLLTSLPRRELQPRAHCPSRLTKKEMKA